MACYQSKVFHPSWRSGVGWEDKAESPEPGLWRGFAWRARSGLRWHCTVKLQTKRIAKLQTMHCRAADTALRSCMPLSLQVPIRKRETWNQTKFRTGTQDFPGTIRKSTSFWTNTITRTTRESVALWMCCLSQSLPDNSAWRIFGSLDNFWKSDALNTW